jgi:hypothetical protein
LQSQLSTSALFVTKRCETMICWGDMVEIPARHLARQNGSQVTLILD